MPVPNSIADLSINPSDNYPGGSEQVFPNLDDYLRAHASFIAQLSEEIKAAGIPIGGVTWWGGARSGVTLPRVPLDGQLLNRADYPQLWAFVSAGGYPLVVETAWQSTPLSRASFSSGNGSTTFRMPDLNGKQTGSIGAVVLRGDGEKSAGSPGLLQDSQNLKHAHGGSTNKVGEHTHKVSGTTALGGEHSHPNGNDGWGVQRASSTAAVAAGGGATSYTGLAGSHGHSIDGTAELAGSHEHTVTVQEAGGDEARGKSATGCFVMRVR